MRRSARLRWRGPGAVLLALLGCACGEPDRERAEALVRRYNEKLIEAYGAGDPEAVEGVAGPDEATKITGLIGVKLDQGITLDATLHELRILGVEGAGDEVIVTTEESWSYADRRIGSGEQVGEASRDRYWMSYTLSRIDGNRVVARVDFALPPLIGRSTAPNGAPTDVMHGVDTRPPGPK